MSSSQVRKTSVLGRAGNLTPEQQQVLDAFQAEIRNQKVPIEDDIHTHLRFLRARKFDLKLALQMYLDQVKWREEHGIDLLLTKEVPKIDMIRSCVPYSFHGRDKLNRPLYVERTGRIDPNMVDYLTDEEMLHCHLWSMEISVYRCYDEIKRTESHVETFANIMDLDGMTMAHRYATGVIQLFAACDSKNYPERMGMLCVINAPSIFPMLWNLIKGWLDPVTAAKIYILGKNYREVLAELIDLDQLPVEMGGTCDKCNKMQDGKKVCVTYPTREELDKCLTATGFSEYTKLKVKNGTKFTWDIPVQKLTNTFWHFKTDGEIDYSVSFVTSNAVIPIFKTKRVKQTPFGFQGSYIAQFEGTISITLDNSFSWMTSKNLEYSSRIEPWNEAASRKKAFDLCRETVTSADKLFPDLVDQKDEH